MVELKSGYIMKNNIVTRILLSAITPVMAAGCLESTVGPIDKDTVPPGPLKDVTWTPTPGGAEISYEYPTDSDLLYANASLTKKDGTVLDFKASLYTNILNIEGLGDTDTYTVKLEAVDRSENRSEPVYIDITPDTPPVMKAIETIDVVADFGGITVSFENETRANLVFEVYTANEDNVMENVETFYTELASGSFSVRGFDAVEREFQIRVRDTFGNWSDTWSGKFTPIYEKELDKSLWQEYILPGDADCNSWSCKMEYIWDGRISADADGQTGCHTGSDGGSEPKYFTFDLGVKAKLSRFTLWPLQDDKHYFNDVSPRQYEIWGCADTPPADGSWDNWVRLIEYEVIKPSGYPVGNLSEDDRIAGQNGDSANFPADAPAVRYIRFKSIKNWVGNSNVTFTEITLWGDDSVEQ